MEVSIRRFEKTDIPKKVEWINNPENNQFLHYDIPISVESTEKWFDSHAGDDTRYDAVIEADGVPVGRQHCGPSSGSRRCRHGLRVP